MKRIFFSFFFGASLFCAPLLASAQEDAVTKSFLEHVEATLSSDFSLAGIASLSGEAEGKNFLTLASVLQAAKQGLRFEEHGDLKVFFDTISFARDDRYNETPAFSGTLRAGYDAFSDLKNQELRFKVRDLDLEVSAEEKEVKDIVEGFFELYKIGQNNVYGINLDDILSFVEEAEGEEFQEIFSHLSSFYADLGGNVAKLYGILLESGLLSVVQEGNGDFVLSLSSDGKNINAKKLLEILPLFGVPQKIIQEAKSEMPSDSIIQSILHEVLQYVDLQVIYTPKKGTFSHITPSLQFSFPYEIEKMNYETYTYEVEKTIDFSFDFSGDFTLSSLKKEVILPTPDVDLGKFFRAVFTMVKREQAIWGNYEDNYGYENNSFEEDFDGFPENTKDGEDGYYYRNIQNRSLYKDPSLIKRR